MKTRTWLDYAVWGVGAVVVILGAYLAYSVWAQNVYNRETSPSGRAIKNLQQIVRQKPGEVKPRIRLAEAYAADGQLDNAVTQYNEALKIEKEYGDALVGLGQIAMKRKDWKLAEQFWHRTIAKLKDGEFAGKDTRLEQAYYYLGTALFEQHEYQDAASYLKEAIRIRPDASDTHYLLSVTYGKLGNEGKRKEELNVALAFDPLMAEANYDLGEILLADGKTALAAEHFRTSAESAPNVDKPRIALDRLGPVEEHVKLASAELKAGKIASATIEARIAVAVDPQDAGAVRLLAGLYERQKDYAGALDAYEKLSQLLPNDKEAAASADRMRKKVVQ